MIHKILLFLCFSFVVSAQILPPLEPISEDEPKKEAIKEENSKKDWKENLHYGGNVWLGFYGSLYFEATPMVGIDISKKGTVAGVGASVLYYGADKRNGGGLCLGPKVFIRQGVWRSTFVHAEYELMNASPLNFYDTDPNSVTGAIIKNKWGGTGYIGAGFYQNGQRKQGGGFLSVLYNINAPNSGFINRQSIGDGRFVLRLGFLI